MANAWHEFVSDVLLIPLGGCDLVLGIQWLATLRTIKWNFKKLKMEFNLKGTNYVMRGLKTDKVQMMAPEQQPKALMNAAHLCMLQLVSTTPTYCQFMGGTTIETTPAMLQPLLQQYHDIFQEP